MASRSRARFPFVHPASVRALALLLVLLAFERTAPAQSGAWSDEFDRPGLLGRVFAVSDFGGELVAGGLAIEADGRKLGLLARYDGQHWSPIGSGIQGFVVEDLALYRGRLVAAGNFDLAGGASVKSIASWDGTQWQPLRGGIGLSFASLGTVYAMAVFQNELYVAGMFDRADNVVVANIARWDGTQWSAVGSGFDGDVYALEAGADGKLYAGGAFGRAGSVAASNIAAWDGASWSAVGPGIGVPFNSPVRALEWHASKLWAGGYFDLPGGALYEKLASWDGSSWQAQGSFPDSSIGTQIDSLLSVGTDLYVGGNIVSVDGIDVERIARLSGTQWNSIGGVRGFANTNVVLALALHAGEVVAGGNFTNAGPSSAAAASVVSNSIASFDGSAWKQIGKGLGFNGSVSAGLLWNGGVAVVGSFNEAGRSSAPFAAFFDGVDWRRLGEFDGPAYDLCMFQNELIVAGNFSSVDGQSIVGVAAFDGSTWHGFGSGFGGGYGGLTVAVYRNQLYAGTIGGVLRWNGSNWEPFAQQIFGSVSDLHVHDGLLYIAGYFSALGGHIASWNGVTQQLVGGGMNDSVDTLASYNGSLVAGGSFTQAGGLAANRLARWDGSSWSAIPGVTGKEVTKLAVFSGQLVASGNPLQSGPALSYIGRWDGALWHALGGGIGGPAGALIADELGGHLYAGGLFQDAEGRPSWNFARWDSGSGTATSFCFGDGSSVPCPCGNSGLPGRGCQNSLSSGGALLTATGAASLANDTLGLTSSGELPNALSVLLQGTTAISPRAFGDGLRCAGGSVKRLYVRKAAGGIVLAPQPGDPSISARSAALGDPISPGATRHYQTYYRDPQPGFCPNPLGDSWNISSGLTLTWGQ